MFSRRVTITACRTARSSIDKEKQRTKGKWKIPLTLFLPLHYVEFLAMSSISHLIRTSHQLAKAHTSYHLLQIPLIPHHQKTPLSDMRFFIFDTLLAPPAFFPPPNRSTLVKPSPRLVSTQPSAAMVSFPFYYQRRTSPHLPRLPHDSSEPYCLASVRNSSSPNSSLSGGNVKASKHPCPSKLGSTILPNITSFLCANLAREGRLDEEIGRRQNAFSACLPT